MSTDTAPGVPQGSAIPDRHIHPVVKVGLFGTAALATVFGLVEVWKSSGGSSARSEGNINNPTQPAEGGIDPIVAPGALPTARGPVATITTEAIPTPDEFQEALKLLSAKSVQFLQRELGYVWGGDQTKIDYLVDDETGTIRLFDIGKNPDDAHTQHIDLHRMTAADGSDVLVPDRFVTAFTEEKTLNYKGVNLNMETAVDYHVATHRSFPVAEIFSNPDFLHPTTREDAPTAQAHFMTERIYEAWQRNSIDQAILDQRRNVTYTQFMAMWSERQGGVGNISDMDMWIRADDPTTDKYEPLLTGFNLLDIETFRTAFVSDSYGVETTGTANINSARVLWPGVLEIMVGEGELVNSFAGDSGHLGYIYGYAWYTITTGRSVNSGTPPKEFSILYYMIGKVTWEANGKTYGGQAWSSIFYTSNPSPADLYFEK